jgi:hypothetical protein
MRPQSQRRADAFTREVHGARNPFGVMDVPDPDADEVKAFAVEAQLDGSAEDENAQAWGATGPHGPHIEGCWSSRWNGGVDPTIPGDGEGKWKDGSAEIRTVGNRVYLLFDWDRGARRGLIEARHQGATKLVGRYVNLTAPEITRPWVGLIVCYARVDGRWPGGRLDFRR